MSTTEADTRGMTNEDTALARELNAQVNLWSGEGEGRLQLEKDREATKAYFLQHVNGHMRWFHDGLEEKLGYMFGANLDGPQDTGHEYYDKEVFDQYEDTFIKAAYRRAGAFKFRFITFMGAFSFFNKYGTKTLDGSLYLERFEDRAVVCALALGRGDTKLVNKLIDEIMTGRLVPATPTFSNAGKKNAGMLVSCRLLEVSDSLHSIMVHGADGAAQLSKVGAGVALNITSIRSAGDPVKGVQGAGVGILPWCKIFESVVNAVDQGGKRAGACAVYYSAHGWDVLEFLDSKKVTADEQTRLSSLSLGLVMPDITYRLAAENKAMALFSPYDVEKVYGVPFADISVTEKYEEMAANPNIRKKYIQAQDLFRRIAKVQGESGYPYLLNIDTVNRANPIHGMIKHSNLCVTGDTLLLTDAGYRRADELHREGKPLRVVVDARTEDGAHHKDFEARIVDALPMHKTAENAQVLKVETKQGYSLRATEWHKMYVQRTTGPAHKRTVMIEKIPLADVRVGDRLLVLSGEAPGQQGANRPDEAYIAGVLAGDGTYAPQRDGGHAPRLDLYGPKRQLAASIERSVHAVLVDADTSHHSANATPRFVPAALADRVSLCSAPLGRVLEALGVNRASKLSVPAFVMEGDLETVGAYLSGIVQTDGSVTGSVDAKSCSVEIGSVSEPFLQQLQVLMTRIGVKSQIYPTRGAGTAELPDGKGRTRAYPVQALHSLRVSNRISRERLMRHVHLRAEQAQSFADLTAGQRASSRVPNDLFTAEVTAITADGVEDVYDTTVPGVHSLVFNGIVTGNCTEIVQVSEPSVINDKREYEHVGRDVSCNLASLNVALFMRSPDFGKSIETAMRGLTAVSDMDDCSIIPSLKRGNDLSHAVGLGMMNLAGAVAGDLGVEYDSEEARDFAATFAMMMNFHSIRASKRIAQERGETFFEFDKSQYADGLYFTPFIEGDFTPKTKLVREYFELAGHHVPTSADWKSLAASVQKNGMYHAYRLAIAPTGSISFLSASTASVAPAIAPVESRKENKLGVVYVPAYGLTNDNIKLYKDAYTVGPKALIDMMAVIQPHIDQAISTTLFFPFGTKGNALYKAQRYAWQKGLKSLYYTRIQNTQTENIEGCVSCAV